MGGDVEIIMAKSNLQIAIETEAAALRAAAKKQAEEKYRLTIEKGEQDVLRMINSEYGGELRPWRVKAWSHFHVSGLGGGVQNFEKIILAHSREEALEKARKMKEYPPQDGWGFSQHGVDTTPAFDQ